MSISSPFSIAIVLTACGIETSRHRLLHLQRVLPPIAIVLTACGIETAAKAFAFFTSSLRLIAIVLTACGIETQLHGYRNRHPCFY